MPTLAVAGLVVAGAALALVAISWRFRAVLAGVLGAVAAASALYALIAEPEGTTTLVGALLALLIGIALCVLGQLVDRLLNGDRADGD